VGTVVNVGLSFRTNNLERFRIESTGFLRSFTDGSMSNPSFSWDSDTDTGFYRNGDDTFNFAAGGVEFIELNEGTDDELIINANSYDINTRIETDNEANALFVDGANDNIGLGTNNHDTSSQLEMTYSDRGLLINRISLSATNVAAPVTSPATGLLVYNTATSGSGTAGSGNTTGIYGVAINTSGVRQGGYFTMNKSGIVNVTPPVTDDPIALLAGFNGTDYFGGYFDGNQDNNFGGGGPNAGEDYAYVGIRTGGTTYKIVCAGSNSTMVIDSKGNKRVLFSPEAPEILFEDYGTGTLVNGTATISLDPMLSSIIHVSNDHPIKVFIQLEGDCNGVYVTDKSASGFTVKELNLGRSNVPFSWHIVANRADTVINGEIISKHVNVRFPIGPEKITPSQIIDNKAINAQKDASKSIK
jgi:hypothetical protein